MGEHKIGNSDFSKVPLESELVEEVKKYLEKQNPDFMIYSKKNSFHEIEKVVKKIVSNQNQFDMIINAQSLSAAKLYLGVKKILYRFVLSKDPPGLNELFDAQLRCVNELNGNLYSVTKSARESLTNFEHIVDVRTVENRIDHTSKRNLEQTIENLTSDIKKEETTLEGLDINDERYLGQQLRIRNLKRDFNELTTKYYILSESQRYHEGERVYFEDLENILKTTIQTSERALNRAVLVHDTLNKAKTIYQSVGDLLNAVGVIARPINMIRSDVKEIESILFRGVQHIKEQVLSGVDYKGVFGNDSPMIGLLNDLRKTKYYKQTE